MHSRLDHSIHMQYRSLIALFRSLASNPPTVRNAVPRYQKLMVAMSLGVATSLGAQAAESMPKGMKGWTYYISLHKMGYVRTPQQACALNAANHFGVELNYMMPSPLPKPIYECYYRNPFGGLLFNYGNTILHCEAGYTTATPGACVKWAEPPRPPSCSPGKPGYAVGNPVAVASGAKVQTETDVPGSPNGTLRIARTYRTLRMGGSGQSGGQGWSFSFDRHFSLAYSSLRPPAIPEAVTGTFGDGTYFEFSQQAPGVYVSKLDKRESLRSTGAAADDWMLTTRDGSIERYKKVNRKLVLVSSHTGEGLGQLYTYGPDDKLATIADGSGRSLTVSWAGDAVASISGATGSVHYGYELEKASDGSEIAQTERLATVAFHDAGNVLQSTRRYHYEDPNYRHLLTGITDENGARFATYAYNEFGQAVLSEHAGGADRYTFAYPDKAKRIITDPLGTERQLSIADTSNANGYATGGVVTSASQPSGAGCGPGSGTLTYDRIGLPTSSTDFNERKTCFITDSARGLVTSQVAGLTPAASCPASATEAIAATSRRTSTQWHPDVELETAVASPKQITRYVYNGQSDASGAVASCAGNAMLPNGKPIVFLCAKTVQATRDAHGAAGFTAQPDGRPRTWRYSYNPNGQLLKSNGPADALGQAVTVSNVYYDDTTASHAKGDLASTQNAVGEQTKFLEYTKDGLPSKILRANGVTVDLVYGARQRIESATVAGSQGGNEITRYSYDHAGQLTGIAAPDGTTVTLAYDDAHRVTALTDGVGNQVTLTLDNMGNVTREELCDAAGALVKVRNQAFDALNRLATLQRGTQQATALQYGRGGNLRAVTDPLDRITTAQFDHLDRMTQAVLPPASPGKTPTLTSYGYDHQDSLVSVTDPRTLTTRYTLDGFGQQKGVEQSGHQYRDVRVRRCRQHGIEPGWPRGHNRLPL